MSSRPSRGAARLAAILDALPDGLVLVNCNGTVVNANTIALGMFETPGTALVGRGLLDLLPAFDSRLIPGSMRRPEGADDQGRTKPTRMVARRTDGSEFPAEVTSANLEDGREAYDSYTSYTGDELLMLVVRDLSGTVDTEAELARSQRQTEMILRAASEGVVGTDTDGRVVLVNPAAAQILGYRASDLGGQALHQLILHSRGDGEAFPYEESPLADTLKSGRKHRVRSQVLWAKSGAQVPVDLTTAPVRDGDQLVGAVMTFTDRRPYEELAEQHAAELADKSERYSAEIEKQAERYAALAARHEQLTAVLGEALRGPLVELRTELSTLAADPAGQLWPEANQLLHHLAAGYARMTTLVDNVLSFQRLDAGTDQLKKTVTLLDAVVAAGVEGAIELIGPGRAQFAVHAPPIEAEVDAARLSTALAHLVADVAGVDSTGRARPVPGGGYVDSTIVVAAAQRGEVVRIEVRGPYAGGDPVHEPIVRGIVTAHGGVLQTHDVPGMSGSAYVLEVPLGAGAGTVPSPAAAVSAPSPASGEGPGTGIALPSQQSSSGTAAGTAAGAGAGDTTGGGRRRARRASTDAFLESAVAPEGVSEPTGRRRGRTEDGGTGAGTAPAAPAPAPDLIPTQNSGPGGAGAGPGTGTGTGTAEPTGRRRGRPNPSEGAVVTAAEGAQGRAALGETVPPQGVPSDAPTGRRARRPEGAMPALPPALEAVQPQPTPQSSSLSPSQPPSPSQPLPQVQPEPQPSGRRARRALGAAPTPSPGVEGPRSAFALPPAAADRAPEPGPGVPPASEGGHDAVRTEPGIDHDHTPPQPHPVPAPTGRRRARREPEPASAPGVDWPESGTSGSGLAGPAQGPTSSGLAGPAQGPTRNGLAGPAQGPTSTGGAGMPHGVPMPPAPPSSSSVPPVSPVPPVPPASSVAPAASGTAPAPAAPGGQETRSATGSVPLPPAMPRPATPRPAAQPLPAESPAAASGSAAQDPGASQGRAFSVRTLGQGVPFAQQIAAQQAGPVPAPAPAPTAVGRRRKLAAPPEGERPAAADSAARPHPQPQPQPLLSTPPEGRAYAIGAPDEDGPEGPEPLDGPGGAVEVANKPQPQPIDDELPPEPLDNPRRLLVWPAPDVSTQQALSDRGYRPVIVHSREEVDAQIAAFPAALFVDPLTGPITRTALQSLRQAAVAAEVPVLLAAGLGQATREAAYGADPAVLLKALAPRDSEQHPSRVLLIEEHDDIAAALAATLERRGMQVARAGADTDAVTLAQQMRPNLVVMDLMQVRRRRAGIIDWLRANGQLNRTPLVVYTSAGLDQAELPKLSSGETVLFLAERSTSPEVQSRIVDLLAKIGTN